MIARLRPPSESPPLHGMHRARHLVATMFIERRSAARRERVTVAAWKGWLFALWVLAMGAAYAAHLAGWF